MAFFRRPMKRLSCAGVDLGHFACSAASLRSRAFLQRNLRLSCSLLCWIGGDCDWRCHFSAVPLRGAFLDGAPHFCVRGVVSDGDCAPDDKPQWRLVISVGRLGGTCCRRECSRLRCNNRVALSWFAVAAGLVRILKVRSQLGSMISRWVQLP